VYYVPDGGSQRRQIYEQLRRARSWQEAQRVYHRYQDQLHPTHVSYLASTLPDRVGPQRMSASEQLQLQQMLQQLAFKLRSQASQHSPVAMARAASALAQLGYTDEDIMQWLVQQAQRQQADSHRWAGKADWCLHVCVALLRLLRLLRLAAVNGAAGWWPGSRCGRHGACNTG
jgi:hypothetical protein